jgi:arylsulfatase
MKLKSIQPFLLLTIFSLCFSFSGRAEKPTNFIVIYLDDMGFGDLSLTGAIGYTTPNIDKMAASGMFFSRYYSPQAVCSASRAGLLTGCYPNRVGFRGALDHTAKTGINAAEETIAEILKQKGYATAAGGQYAPWCSWLDPPGRDVPPFLGFGQAVCA